MPEDQEVIARFADFHTLEPTASAIDESHLGLLRIGFVSKEVL
jgi:hypothetical protein